MTDVSNDSPVLNLLASMTADSLEATTLDPASLMLVRIAALVAVDAPEASYVVNIEPAADVDIGVETVRGLLCAIAPIVGTARVVSAIGKIVGALGVALEAELEALEAEVAEEEEEN